MRKSGPEAQERAAAGAHWRQVNTLTESCGSEYSAEAAGDYGRLRCRVLRRQLAHDPRVAYSFAISNESHGEAHVLAFVPDPRDGRHRTIVQTVVAPISDFSTTVTLERVIGGMLPEVRLAISSGDAQFTLVVPSVHAELRLGELPAAEFALPATTPNFAPLPGTMLPLARTAGPAAGPPHVVARTYAAPLPAARLRPAPQVLPMIGLFLALVAAVGAFMFRPRIDALAVPSLAAPGARVAVTYRATGLGSADYAMLGPDGSRLAGGALALGTGTFALTLPAGTDLPGSRAYLLRLRLTGPLGSAVAEQYVHIAAPPVATPRPRPRRKALVLAPLAPPQIRSLALDRATLAGGETVNVYYDVSAASGTVALIDPATQVTYGRTELAASGHATFTAPHVDSERLVSVVVTATRGSATTQSRVGLTLNPEADSTGPAGAPAADGGGRGDAPMSALLAPSAVRAGQRFRVTVHGAAAGLRLVLLDDHGTELARRDLADADAGSVDLTAPPVNAAERLIIEGTYPDGVGSETLVRPIMVTP